MSPAARSLTSASPAPPPPAASAPPASSSPPSPPAPYVWYFAYGSNMSPQVLGGRRQVWPLRSIACRLPGHALNFASLGLPYAEPGFGSVERLDGRPFELYEIGDRVQSAEEDEREWAREDREAKGEVLGREEAAPPPRHSHAPSPRAAPAPMAAVGEVQGVAHLLTAEQWLEVLRTEGDAGKRDAIVYSVAKVRVQPLHGGGAEDERRPEDEEREEERGEGEGTKRNEKDASPSSSASSSSPASAFSTAPLASPPSSFAHPSHTPPSASLPATTTSGLPTRPTGPFPAFTLVCSRRMVERLGDRKPLPSKRYLDILRQGAAHLRLEPRYLDALASVAPYAPRTRLAERLGPFFRSVGFGSIGLSERISKRAAQAMLRVRGGDGAEAPDGDGHAAGGATLERKPGVPPPGPAVTMRVVAALFNLAWLAHDLVLKRIAGSGLNNEQ